jgi:hypothetical protein
VGSRVFPLPWRWRVVLFQSNRHRIALLANSLRLQSLSSNSISFLL